jgi:DNA (cytosine-5)-methyltransferase 1
VDCIHAGFPCQDISNAGNQAGVGPETRSGLYREVLRIAGVVRPKYLFLENVSAIVTNGLDTVLSDLAALGYDSEWLCIRASDCGAKHHRDRWWLLADTNSHNRSTDERKPDARADRRDKPCGGCEAMADTKRKRQQRQGEYEQSERSAQAGYRETINAATGCGQEFWQVEPGLGRVADGVAYRVDRLKALGNGQVPLQAAVAWKLLGGP